MKYLNIALLFSILMAGAACDPLSDYRDDLDENLEKDDDWFIYISERSLASEEEFNAESPYVLSDDDYASSPNENVATYKSFSERDPFEEHLPACITHLYGNTGELVTAAFAFYDGSATIDSSCFVTFVRQSPATESYWQVVPNYNLEETDNEESTNLYELTAADYTLVGESYPNFDLRYNTKADIVAKINTIIKTRFMLELDEGQIWEVEFATYGSSEENITSPMFLEVVAD